MRGMLGHEVEVRDNGGRVEEGWSEDEEGREGPGGEDGFCEGAC